MRDASKLRKAPEASFQLVPSLQRKPRAEKMLGAVWSECGFDPRGAISFALLISRAAGAQQN